MDNTIFFKLRDAALSLLNNPHGCPMCDSGKLRNPEKQHWPNCPFDNAQKLIGELNEKAFTERERKIIFNAMEEYSDIENIENNLEIAKMRNEIVSFCTNVGQLLQSVKVEWKQENCWSDWDEEQIQKCMELIRKYNVDSGGI